MPSHTPEKLRPALPTSEKMNTTKALTARTFHLQSRVSPVLSPVPPPFGASWGCSPSPLPSTWRFPSFPAVYAPVPLERSFCRYRKQHCCKPAVCFIQPSSSFPVFKTIYPQNWSCLIFLQHPKFFSTSINNQTTPARAWLPLFSFSLLTDDTVKTKVSCWQLNSRLLINPGDKAWFHPTVRHAENHNHSTRFGRLLADNWAQELRSNQALQNSALPFWMPDSPFQTTEQDLVHRWQQLLHNHQGSFRPKTRRDFAHLV